jgi:hypothetical protein
VLIARIIGVVLAALLFAGAHIAGTVLDRASSERVAAEAARVAQEGATQVRDALTEQSRTVSRMASDAMAIPPLVAALNGHTDARDLADMLSSAPWWEPFRSSGLSAAASYRGHLVAFAEPGLRGVPFGQVIAQVRVHGETSSGTLAGQTHAHLVSALTVPGTVSYPPVVFVLGKALDEAMLARLADTARGSVMVVDGKRSVGHAGPDGELLERTLRPDRTDRGEPGWAMSWFAMGPDLAMWVGTRPLEIARAQASVDKRKKAGLWGGALLLAVPIVVSAFRRQPPAPAKRRGRPRTRTVGVGGPIGPAAPAPVARPRPADPPPEIEAMLARYQLIDRIAEGTEAEVFTAISHGGGGPRRTLVVKRLRGDQIENPAAVTHYTEEAALLARLSHPNLVSVYDGGEVDGTYFIAEEYVVGRDLGRIAQKLAESKKPPLSPAAALYVMHEVLGGLAYLHTACPAQDAPHGFLHHDLAPRKVMVSRLGKVKLLDFKIVRVHQQAPQSELAGPKGPVDFMSPEQARGRPLIDARSDLFSVGLLLFHCATGETLYRGDTQYDRVSRAAHGPGPHEHARIATLAAPLAGLLKKALDPHPERRFQSAEEFLAAVAPHIEGGEDEVAGIISDLFDEELQQEIDRLSGGAAAPAVGRA